MAKMFAGLDVADKTTAICVLNPTGEIVLEASAATEAAAIGDVLKPYRRMLGGIGHESGSKAMWLHKELAKKKWPVVCLDAMHTHAALAANRNKTDKNDARGIAEVLSRGIYTTAYVRSDASQNARTILTHRKAIIRKRIDLERLTAMNLKLIGGKLSKTDDGALMAVPQKRKRLESDVSLVFAGTLKIVEVLRAEGERLDKLVERLAKEDPICRRLMTVPGVGPVTAYAYRAAVDDPHRFTSSRNVAAHFGLTPRTFQSGEASYTGRISKRGDVEMRSLLYQAASSIINISKSPWRVRLWAKHLASTKGFKVGAVACARKLAVVMHKMWITERDFDPSM